MKNYTCYAARSSGRALTSELDFKMQDRKMRDHVHFLTIKFCYIQQGGDCAIRSVCLSVSTITGLVQK